MYTFRGVKVCKLLLNANCVKWKYVNEMFDVQCYAYDVQCYAYFHKKI